MVGDMRRSAHNPAMIAAARYFRMSAESSVESRTAFEAAVRAIIDPMIVLGLDLVLIGKAGPWPTTKVGSGEYLFNAFNPRRQVNQFKRQPKDLCPTQFQTPVPMIDARPLGRKPAFRKASRSDGPDIPTA
jgi:hypothetical protein